MALYGNDYRNGTAQSKKLYGNTNKTNLAVNKALSPKYRDEQYIDKIGAYHMIGDDDYEPQRVNNFEIHIYGLTNNINYYNKANFGVNDKKFRSVNGLVMDEVAAQECLTLSVASVSSLSTTISPIEIPYGNTKVKYAGLPNVENATITYNDYIGKDTERVLTGWFGQVFNQHTEKIGRASTYKKPALLVETAPDGTCSRIWQLKGCFPTALNLGEYSYSNGGTTVRQITMTLTYDIMVPLDSAFGAGTNGSAIGNVYNM